MNFSTKLTNWYLKNKRDFPWRNTKSTYFIWLSEVILQQTRTEQGLPYYLSFIKKYPKIKDLANADETEVLKLWQGLGYYSRARNLHCTAKFIVNELKGKFPTKYKELIQLKGVGDYTASAIASICYNERCAVVDGNVYRVLARYFGIETPINSSKGIKNFKILAQKLLPKDNIGLYNQAIMDFGSSICSPKKTKCTSCILNDSCYALQYKKVNQLPIKTSKTKIRKRFFNYLVIISPDRKIILSKRIGNDIWKNLYEFPLIESNKVIPKKEIISNTIFTEIIKNKNPTIIKYNKLPIIHKLSHQHIYTTFWIINTNANTNKLTGLDEIKNHPIPTLIDNFIKDFFK